MKPAENAPTKPSKDMQWIYFLGSHNYAWIEHKNIKPYLQHKEQFRKKTLESAMSEMDEIIENLSADPNYKIPFVVYNAPTPKKPRKSSGSVKSTPSSEKKRKEPLKEKNTPVPRKKQRSSTSLESGPQVVPRKKARAYSPSFDNSGSIEEPEDGVEVLSEKSRKTGKPIILNTVNLNTSKEIFGFLADNIYSEGIIKNLIKSGHKLHVYSPSSALLESLQEHADKQKTYFKAFNNYKQVVQNSRHIFSCMPNPEKALEMAVKMCQNGFKDKGLIEMTSVDPTTSQDISSLVEKAGGMYVEAMLQGNKTEAENGEMIVLSAGDPQLFVTIQSCLKSIGKASFLLGTIGMAAKVHLIFQMMRGVFLSSLAEGYAMADRCSIKLDAFNNIFNMTHMSSEYLKSKSRLIVHKRASDPTETEEPVEQLQRDMAQGLEMSNQFRQPMPLASNANEILKQARRLGHDKQDTAVVYTRTRYY
ncbi:cytokine-like nuclear factor N-PAC isoform X2 [Anthonomus grandis grandis]|uniref:cytokine-like nuclear factor N-PAC isoform X2 n=1 Tax=Anthonomus grandis grandis TaxID=2921223 RepID=UPI0021655316|nr:cytokine-like nuclear factor N-PAC isoform X2 [Anthonomus grandis grandis]